jgi:hypothetical protein
MCHFHSQAARFRLFSFHLRPCHAFSSWPSDHPPIASDLTTKAVSDPNPPTSLVSTCTTPSTIAAWRTVYGDTPTLGHRLIVLSAADVARIDSRGPSTLLPCGFSIRPFIHLSSIHSSSLIPWSWALECMCILILERTYGLFLLLS